MDSIWMVSENKVSFNIIERSKRYLKSVFWSQDMQTSVTALH